MKVTLEGMVMDAEMMTEVTTSRIPQVIGRQVHLKIELRDVDSIDLVHLYDLIYEYVTITIATDESETK